MSTKTLVADPLRRALASIPDSCRYMGNVSRAKFYADILPELETVHLGARHFVVVSSMDRLIATLTQKPTAQRPTQSERGGCEGTRLFGIDSRATAGLREAVRRPDRARRRSGARCRTVPQIDDGSNVGHRRLPHGR
jgi:hypothetical protein